MTKTIRYRHGSENAWLQHLNSSQARPLVRLAEMPGRFRTLPEWDTSSISLNEHLVYFLAQETGQVEVDGNSHRCPRGSVWWIMPGTKFRFHSDQSPLVWRLRFSLITKQKAAVLLPPRRYYFLLNNPTVAETVHNLLVELSHQDRWQSTALRSGLTQFALLFFRSSQASPQQILTQQQREALSRLQENVGSERWLQPRDLARAAGLSLDYFSRVFHRTEGLSPRQWLVRQRLSYAVVLLQETPLRIGEIAQRLGYANPHLFSRQFTACFGRSPRSYRQ